MPYVRDLLLKVQALYEERMKGAGEEPAAVEEPVAPAEDAAPAAPTDELE